MKSEVVMNNTQTEKRTYPWLGHCFIGDKQWERVVLFIDHSVGIVVSAIGNRTVLGNYDESWSEDLFEEFKGRVILSND